MAMEPPTIALMFSSLGLLKLLSRFRGSLGLGDKPNGTQSMDTGQVTENEKEIPRGLTP